MGRKARLQRLSIGLGMAIAILAFSSSVLARSDALRGEQSGRGDLDARGQEATVTLDDLLRIAGENNPEIQAAQQSTHAKKELIEAAKTLPDPTVTFQHMGDLVPLRLQKGDPASARTYGFEQEIPFPGKLGLKGKIASKEAEVEQWNEALTHRKVLSELKQAYYDLFLIHKSIDIVKKDKDLLQSFEKIAETKYQVGQGIQQDVFKAQVELSKLIDRLAVLEQRLRISEAQINTLLYRPADTPVGNPVEYKKGEIKHSVDELKQLALENSPAIKAQEEEVNRRQYSVKLAEREYYPDFAVGFTYFDRESIPEMYGVMLKAKVPLYFWRKQRPELNSARYSLDSARKMRESTTSTVDFQIKQSYTVATTADRLIKLYSSAVIPQARLSLQSAMAGYQVGKTDFLTLIDSLTGVLEYELKYQESMAEYQKALAQIEPLVGKELTR